MWYRLSMFGFVAALGCSEADRPEGGASEGLHPYMCIAPLDASDCFAVLVRKQNVPITEAVMKLAKCTFNSAPADPPAEGAAENATASMAKTPVGTVDAHCESADGELVVDLHMEALAQVPVRETGLVHTRRPDLSWFRLRATGETAAAFPEYVGEPIERTYSGEVLGALRAELKGPAQFFCDGDGDGIEDEEDGCPPLPRPAQGDSVYEGQLVVQDDRNPNQPGRITITMSWLLSLPGLPLGCLDSLGYPRPCD